VKPMLADFEHKSGRGDSSASTTDRLLLFIPCYNCAPQIARVLDSINTRIATRFAEVLVLDNRSTDDTVDRAKSAARTVSGVPVTVACNHRNVHLGGSHKAAFEYAERGQFSHVVVLHGDDQATLADLDPVLDAGLHRENDACLGARFMPGARRQGYSAFRTIGNRVFNLLFSAVTRRQICDLGSGLNIFARPVFAAPSIVRASDDLRFNVYLLLSMIDQGRRLLFFPIVWRDDDQVSNVRLVSQARRTLSIAWEYAARRRRFRTADHRDLPIDDYAFDIVARYGGVTRNV
jgi:dolichol-phosphate mannosyltransferase